MEKKKIAAIKTDFQLEQGPIVRCGALPDGLAEPGRDLIIMI